MLRRSLDVPFGVDLENLDVAIDVAQVDPPAVGREDQAREAHLALGRRLQLPRRNGLVRAGASAGSGTRSITSAVPGIENHQLVGLAGDDQNPPVGRKGQGLRPHAGQFDLPSQRRDRLRHRQHGPIGPVPPDRFPRIAGGRLRRRVLVGRTGRPRSQANQDKAQKPIPSDAFACARAQVPPPKDRKSCPHSDLSLPDRCRHRNEPIEPVVPRDV